jgi:hypothetical protein
MYESFVMNMLLPPALVINVGAGSEKIDSGPQNMTSYADIKD